MLDDALERIDFHFAVDDHPDTIAGTEDRVQIVRDHDDSQLQLLLQIQYQLVELGGADRVEPGRRLIEEQQARIERQRPGQRRTLDHAAGQLAGYFCAASAGRPTSRILSMASSSRCVRRQMQCSIMGSCTFCSTVSEENSAPCWKVTP